MNKVVIPIDYRRWFSFDQIWIWFIDLFNDIHLLFLSLANPHRRDFDRKISFPLGLFQTPDFFLFVVSFDVENRSIESFFVCRWTISKGLEKYSLTILRWWRHNLLVHMKFKWKDSSKRMELFGLLIIFSSRSSDRDFSRRNTDSNKSELRLQMWSTAWKTGWSFELDQTLSLTSPILYVCFFRCITLPCRTSYVGPISLLASNSYEVRRYEETNWEEGTILDRTTNSTKPVPEEVILFTHE